MTIPKAIKLWPWLAAVGSGLLCAGCFPPFDVAWLCWLCLTPLIAAVWFSDNNWRRRWLRDLLLGYVAGLAFFWPAFSWLISVTGTGWFVLQFYMAIYFAIWAWLCGLLRPRASLGASPPPPEPTKWDEMLAAAGRAPAAPKPTSPWLRSTNNLLLAFLLAAAWVTMNGYAAGFSAASAGITFGVAFAHELAAHPDRRVHRRGRALLCGRFRQCHRG